MSTVFIILVYIAIIGFSFHYFSKILKRDTKVDKLSDGAFTVALLAAISIPGIIVTALQLFIKGMVFLLV